MGAWTLSCSNCARQTRRMSPATCCDVTASKWQPGRPVARRRVRRLARTPKAAATHRANFILATYGLNGQAEEPTAGGVAASRWPSLSPCRLLPAAGGHARVAAARVTASRRAAPADQVVASLGRVAGADVCGPGRAEQLGRRPNDHRVTRTLHGRQRRRRAAMEAWLLAQL